jgi:hypothetical protein
MQEFVLEGKGSEVLDQWLRTSFIDDQGTVYLPCGIMSDESQALLCLAYDGVSYVQHLRHIYAPAWWLKKEYPQCAFLIDIMSTKIVRCKS